MIEKAERIATEWGLKNARAAVEAVFRRYSDDYLHGRQPFTSDSVAALQAATAIAQQNTLGQYSQPGKCEALSELDDLLGM